MKAPLHRLAASAWLLSILFASGFICAEEKSASAELRETPVGDIDREHWAWRPLVRPELPPVQNPGWIETCVDRFILARLEKKSLTPLPPADRATLIRRVTFDLTGLPPEPDEVAAFLVDPAPDAYDKLVDRLLTSPAYGPRQALAWLDLARFAETDGFEHDKLRSDAWRYRDWVIDALDADMPYDRFIALQLAGDEIAPKDPAALIATTFCLAGPDMPDLNSQEERRHNVLDELTGAVGAALMGLQMGCAQCHDHKADPISQGDFYRLKAIFAPAVNVTANKSLSVLSEKTGAVPVSFLSIRGDWRRPGPEVPPGYPRVANPWNETPPSTASPGATTGRRAALAQWLTRPDHPLTGRVIVNRLWQQHFGHGLCRTPSDFGYFGEEVSHPELLDWLATELVRQNWNLKKLHRLIVTSAVYRQASHLDAPDWTNEQRAAATESWQKSHATDPENRLFARMNRRRLEGETIRDAMLASAERLSARRGGPGVMPPLPPELLKTLLAGQWTVSPDPEDHARRSIYVFARRNLRYPIFEAFDRPDGNASCAQRPRSTIAPQSLILLNSQFSLSAARQMAGYILSQTASGNGEAADAARLELAYCRTLGRAPAEEERARLLAFLAQQRTLLQEQSHVAEKLALADPTPAGVSPRDSAAWVDLCLALFNLSEFIYVD